MNTIDINLKDMSLYNRLAAKNSKQFIKFGDVLNSNNEYAYTQEKKCQNSICDNVGDKLLVIKHDGSVWTVHKSCYKEYWNINIIK